MSKRLKKLLLALAQFVLIPAVAFATGAVAGKAYVSSYNQTAIPIAGVDSSGNMVPVLLDSDGTVQMRCLP